MNQQDSQPDISNLPPPLAITRTNRFQVDVARGRSALSAVTANTGE